MNYGFFLVKMKVCVGNYSINLIWPESGADKKFFTNWLAIPQKKLKLEAGSQLCLGFRSIDS